MNNQQQLAKLKKCVEDGALCAIERDIIDTFPLYGFPVKVSDSLAAVLFVYDFMPDGYKVIRKSDITGVYCGEEERFLENIIKTERSGFAAQAPSFNMDSMRALCEDLMHTEQLVTVECEDFEENIVLIGRIAAVSGKRLTLRTFNGVGVWDEECASVDLDDVTCVSVGNSYVSVISKYLKEE